MDTDDAEKRVGWYGWAVIGYPIIDVKPIDSNIKDFELDEQRQEDAD